MTCPCTTILYAQSNSAKTAVLVLRYLILQNLFISQTVYYCGDNLHALHLAGLPLHLPEFRRITHVLD